MAITIEGDIQQQVDHFQYLGATTTTTGLHFTGEMDIFIE